MSNGQNRCALCGEPMPPGEEMFQYHGKSGPCPKPPLPETPSPTVTVDRQEWERMRRDNAAMKDALEEIRFHGIDKPSGMGGPEPDEDVSWWKSIAGSCMRKAAIALDSTTPSNAVEEAAGE